ncbi:MAG: tetratricopeptide repeat protein [Planctomycetota bacterium]|nr:tetratricopeptide repeat protein [Planctomycetota bacterium]
MNSFELAKAMHIAGQVKEAAQSYRRILESDPQYVPAINMLGHALFDLGEFEAALEEYRRILRIEPDFEAVQYSLGNVLFKLGYLEEASDAYRRAIDKEPDFSNAHFNLGNVYLDLSRAEEAIEAYEKVLALTPDNQSALFNLGKALTMLQRDDEAFLAFEKVINHNPDFLPAYSEMGHTQLQMGAPDEALAHFQKAIQLDPECDSEHFNLAMTELMLGHHPEAERAFRLALELNPENARYYECLGRVLIDQDHRDEAIDVLKQWIEQEPESARAKHLIAAWSGVDIPTKAPVEYIIEEFDHQAAEYERTLARVKYLAPILINEALRRENMPMDGSACIVDLGCGTGLISPLLQPMASELVGVDLSKPMLEQARRRRQYDELVNEELVSYLQGQTRRFDLIVSADTFVYFGLLEEVFAASMQSLRPGGRMVFTTELLDDMDEQATYRLNPTGRFSHTEAYISRALEACGFEVVDRRVGFLRLEGHAGVNGLIVVARCPEEA